MAFTTVLTEATAIQNEVSSRKSLMQCVRTVRCFENQLSNIFISGQNVVLAITVIITSQLTVSVAWDNSTYLWLAQVLFRKFIGFGGYRLS